MGERKPRTPVTFLLLAVNLSIYIYLAINSENFLQIDRDLMMKYGFMKETFLGGAYHQVFTSIFTHFDLPHFGYNMVFLVFFASKAEELFGSVMTFILYVAIGVATAIVAFFYPLGTVSAGASGAIFGLLGTDLIAQRGLYTGRIWTSFFYGLIFFFLAAATGFLAHLAGLLIGFVVGYWITKDWYPETDAEYDKKTVIIE